MRILVRSRHDPLHAYPVDQVARHNLIADNVGNLVFSQAVHRITSVAGNTVTSNGFALAPRKAAHINENYDLFAVPLANAFRPSHRSQLERLTWLVERLNIPVVVIGVGVQLGTDARDVHRLDGIAPLVRRFVGAVLDRSASIGVRGEITADYLHRLGFRGSDVEVIGCPSMFMYGDGLAVRRRPGPLTAASRVSLNVSPYVSALGPIITANMARYPNLVYTAQDIKTLRMMLSRRDPGDAADIAPDIPYRMSHPLLRDNRTRFCTDPATWFEHLRGVDFSFGTRIHGTIAALLAGTPAVLLAHDSRTLELARYHEIPYRLVADLPADVDAARLYEEADFSGLVRGHAERLGRFVSFLDRNGVPHVFSGEPAAAAGAREFDERLAATRFPAPVGVRSPSSALAHRLWGDARWAARVARRRGGRAVRSTVAGLRGRASR